MILHGIWSARSQPAAGQVIDKVMGVVGLEQVLLTGRVETNDFSLFKRV